MNKGIKYVGDKRVLGIAKGSQVGRRLYLGETMIWDDPIIEFGDEAVKAICISNWGDNKVGGEITESEAAAVTSLAGKFRGNTDITTFNELEYFEGLTEFDVSSGNGEFQGCTKLTDVTIPKLNVDSISLAGLFRGCARLTSVDLSPISTQSITSIQYLFRGNSDITKITLPKGSYSGSAAYAFSACANLTTLTINGQADWSGITTFGTSGQRAFYNCSNLTTINGVIKNISLNIDFSLSPLSVESATMIVNGLSSTATGKTLLLKSSLKTTYEANADFNTAVSNKSNWDIEYA